MKSILVLGAILVGHACVAHLDGGQGMLQGSVASASGVAASSSSSSSSAAALGGSSGSVSSGAYAVQSSVPVVTGSSNVGYSGYSGGQGTSGGSGGSGGVVAVVEGGGVNQQAGTGVRAGSTGGSVTQVETITERRTESGGGGEAVSSAGPNYHGCSHGCTSSCSSGGGCSGGCSAGQLSGILSALPSVIKVMQPSQLNAIREIAEFFLRSAGSGVGGSSPLSTLSTIRVVPRVSYYSSGGSGHTLGSFSSGGSLGRVTSFGGGGGGCSSHRRAYSSGIHY